MDLHIPPAALLPEVLVHQDRQAVGLLAARAADAPELPVAREPGAEELREDQLPDRLEGARVAEKRAHVDREAAHQAVDLLRLPGEVLQVVGEPFVARGAETDRDATLEELALVGGEVQPRALVHDAAEALVTAADRDPCLSHHAQPHAHTSGRIIPEA
jgi:hypothetical protein